MRRKFWRDVPWMEAKLMIETRSCVLFPSPSIGRVPRTNGTLHSNKSCEKEGRQKEVTFSAYSCLMYASFNAQARTAIKSSKYPSNKIKIKRTFSFTPSFVPSLHPSSFVLHHIRWEYVTQGGGLSAMAGRYVGEYPRRGNRGGSFS